MQFENPKFIYIKTCKCGMKYFGMSNRNKKFVLNTYKGSGRYWKRHIAQHKNNIATVIIGEFYNSTNCEKFCKYFSKKNNIVKSKLWANKNNENGVGGSNIGTKFSEETTQKMGESKKGNTNGKGNLGKKHTEESKRKISESMKGIKKPQKTQCCLICEKEISMTKMKQHQDGKKCVKKII